MSSPHFSRRRFLQISSGALLAPFSSMVAGEPVATSPVSPNSKLNHASIGATGMAGSDIKSLTSHPQINLVAVADVDTKHLSQIKTRFPHARLYQDWRELLEKEGDSLDSVNVSIPDHMHAPVAMTAMEMGLHVYGQKPLASTISECRAMAQRANDKKLITQMGIQTSSAYTDRVVVKIIQDGVIGKIKEVHTYCYKAWGDNVPRPKRSDPIPESLDWDKWLGIAESRPFLKDYYHPQQWRKRKSFGTGSLGDMGCHLFSSWSRALQLNAPLSILARDLVSNPDNWPTHEIIDYVFPGTPYTAEETIKVIWYDGNFQLPRKIIEQIGHKKTFMGSVYVGTEGVLHAEYVSTPRLYPREKFKNFRYPKLSPRDHYEDFIHGCINHVQPSAPFQMGAPLTEKVLLGTLASCFPNQKLKWDDRAMQFRNSDAATALVKRSYRKGWEVDGLQ